MTLSSRTRSITLPRTALAAGFIVLLAVACGRAPEQEPEPSSAGVVDEETHATPVPPVLPKVILPDGFEVTIELAITPEELAQGLMYRPSLPTERGMLLIFAEERLPAIWMMNTLVALDIVYLDHTGTVVDVIPNAQPCPAEPCPRYVPKQSAEAVLELAAGAAAAHSVVDGATLRFDLVPDYPSDS
jgi:uncharacterized membrane protein (UPF0127 family)